MSIKINKQTFNFTDSKFENKQYIEEYINSKDLVINNPEEYIIINDKELLLSLNSLYNVHVKSKVSYNTEPEFEKIPDNLLYFCTLPENDKYVSEDVYEFFKQFKIKGNIYNGYLLKNYNCINCERCYGCFNSVDCAECYGCRYCEECSKCTGCDYCLKCQNMKKSEHSSWCKRSQNARFSNSCDDVNNSEYCHDCHKCNNITASWYMNCSSECSFSSNCSSCYECTMHDGDKK